MLLSCTSEPSGVNLDIFRSPSLFRADTTASDHPFCDQTNPVGTPAACKQEHKYKLTWLRPEDTANFQGYRIYFDTVPDDKKWADVQKHPELASVIVHRSPVNDSLVFVFTSDRKTLPDTLLPGQDRIVALDSNGRAELSTGKLVFALVPVYSGSGAQGQPQYAYFVTTDRQAPDVFRPDIRPLPHGLRIAWERPTDRVSFFDPGLDTGVIKGYRLELGLDGRITANRLNSFQPKLKSYRMGGSDSTAAVLDSLELKNGVPDKMLFKLPDGHRSAKHTHPDATDSMYVEIEGMFPQDTLTVQLWAIDSAGNSNDSAMSPVSIRTTDTTQPSTPKLGFDSLSLNGFTITWLAARDSVAGPGGLTEADHPNANIMDYRLTRTMVRAPGERTTSLDRMDTIVQDSLVPTRSQFRIPVRFLPPGATYHMTLFAEDSSGYPSQIDTMNVTTPKVAFADTDSVLTCPPGFIPMPRGKFQLGSNAFPGSDETPPRIAAMAPYCIEPYEHRDSTGQRFVSNVTYEQAEAICEAISPEFATKLCSEAEWERACEGPTADSALALRHGIQSETNDPSILQASCNQATNDSDMAFNFSLRNPICLTTEGVYDMAGNLSEWVRDTYFPNAYNSLSGDTLRLDHGTVFADSGERPPHSLRGGNYLKPDRLQLSAVQNLARCSNRDFPEQVRPVYRDSCLSEDKPRLVVIFGTGLDGHRCFTPKDVFLDPDVTDLRPAPRIDTAILAFHRGSTKVDTQRFSPDSTFRGKKPTSAKLTTKTLAVVKFERILPISAQDSVYDDTLDATEFLDTTQAGLAKIFQREASNSEWTVHKEDGKFAIKYLYAYTQLGSKPALPYYSNRAIGFRCCSLAAKKVVPTDSVAGPSAMSAALHR
ncbi:MAG: SUMF1/EgtB/PvdO family nonheme iron enzyme [Fibrobacteres bacterium]|nr:SUMF1/EgtB/PvdO family nonheme iron enzyme [Fibrobacterota bacterium]